MPKKIKKIKGKISSKKIEKKSSLNSGNGFLSLIDQNFKAGYRFVFDSKYYILFATALFFIIAILGFIFPIFFKQEIQNLIEELINQTQNMGVFELIRYIILNNIKTAFFGMITGIFFGLIPVVILTINGYVIGFVARRSVDVAGFTILWRLLPHGIFEIPAILISVGMGIRLGTFFIFYNKKIDKDFFKIYLEKLFDAIRAFIFIIIPLLIIAGIIEGSLIYLIG